MTILITSLLLLNLLLPLLLVRRLCVSREGLEVNHFLLFSLGFLIYWISPIVFGTLRLFESAPAMGLWYRIFDQVSPKTLVIYLCVCCLCYLCFCAGTLLCQRLRSPSGSSYRRIFFDRRLLNAYLIVGTTIAAAYAYVLRSQLFKGYTVSELYTDTGTRGAFTAASIFLLSLAFVYSIKRDEIHHGALPFSRVVFNPFFAIYFCFAALVASLGGRLYFVSGVLMLLVYKTVFFSRIQRRQTFALAAASVVGVGLAGLVRQGISLNGTNLLLSLAVEPLFNSFSLIHFLSVGEFEAIKVPIFLLSSVVNLVPSVLLPTKALYILNPADYGYTVFSPVGALNSFFSFMINFGVLGTMATFFVFSFVLQYLKENRPSLLARTVYVMVSGWLATSFFRDPFDISIVKAIFQFSVLTPLFLVLSVHLFSQLLRVRTLPADDVSTTVSA